MSFKVRILILGMILFGACEDSLITDCDNCRVSYPESAVLEITLNPARFGENSTILRIYEGPIEDNKVLEEIITRNDSWEYHAMFYKNYTISAEYSIEGKKYIAIDTAYPKIKHDTKTCEEECYYVYGNKVNLALRYN